MAKATFMSIQRGVSAALRRPISSSGNRALRQGLGNRGLPACRKI